MVTKACSWCKKEGEAYLVFFKPKGWIKHKTLDKMDMLFCSLACFQAFMGTELSSRARAAERPMKVEEREELAVAPAQ